MRLTGLFVFLATLFSQCHQQTPASGDAITAKEGTATVAFYNVENLYDTKDNYGVQDGSFTPNGYLKWTEKRYHTKLNHISQALSAINNTPPVIIGLAEVENKNTLKDLMLTQAFAPYNYALIHENGSDSRGIDCALLYNTDFFKVSEWESINIPTFPKNKNIKTRDILYVKGTIFNETIHLYVNHWPSRRDGQEATAFKRLHVVKTLTAHINQVLNKEPNAAILVMGDFNDEATNKSIQNLISETKVLTTLKHKGNNGTINYKGHWYLFDQFISSKALIDNMNLDIHANSYNIFKANFLLFTHPKYGDKRPNRTYGGPNYYGGYSDHLPIWLELNIE